MNLHSVIRGVGESPFEAHPKLRLHGLAIFMSRILSGKTNRSVVPALERTTKHIGFDRQGGEWGQWKGKALLLRLFVRFASVSAVTSPDVPVNEVNAVLVISEAGGDVEGCERSVPDI